MRKYDIVSLYPKINFEKLEHEVLHWASKFASIKQVTFYPHIPESVNGTIIKYLLDICLYDDAPEHESSEIFFFCIPTPSSIFCRSLREATEGDFNDGEWRLWDRYESGPIIENYIIDGPDPGKILYLREGAVAQELKRASVPESATVLDSKTHNTHMDSAPESNTVKISPLPGTTWDKIKMRYVNDDHIEISYPGVTTHSPYSMAKLGLDSKPMLASLFKMFAEHQGDIDNKNMGTQKIKANVSNLRKQLKAIFPEIEGSPIANFSKKNGYCCNFKIS